MQHAYVKAMANSRWCLYERAHVDVRVNRRFIFKFFFKGQHNLIDGALFL